MSTPPIPICIAAGEASGDSLGAALITELLTATDKNFQISAMGGKKMHAAGAKIIVDSTTMGIVGFFEIFKQLKPILHALRTMKKHLKQTRPKCLILIDYPGMNLRFAKYAHKLGIKVLFYVSPQIWAWRRGRLRQMRKNIDHMAVLFPFEETFYQQAGIPVTFVGHPLISTTKVRSDRQNCYQQLNLDPNKKVIAILPGSRRQEINRLLPTIDKAVKLLQQKNKDLQFILVRADSIAPEELDFAKSVIKVTSNLPAALSIADAAICTSGTATLEVALYAVPLVVIYKLAWLTYLIGRMVVKIPHIGLCNIVTKQTVAVELIQNQASAQNIYSEIEHLLTATTYYSQRKQQLQTLRQQLSSGAGSKSVAAIVNNLIAEP